MNGESSIARARQNLKKYWGYDAFRPGQEEVVQSVLDGRQTLVLFPTGGGKSLCYQVPSTVLDGLTVVISPLIALMQDQVDQLTARGIPATSINSAITRYEVEQRLVNARNGMYKMLYCSPERLQTPLWQNMAAELNIVLVAIDEAHCISEWGHDFRPPYRKIRAAMREAGVDPFWMALTATATPEVRRDILEILEFDEPNVISRGFDRPNLKWWVDIHPRKKERLFHYMRRSRGSGLVYAGTRRSCEEISGWLAATGIKAEAYHAGVESGERAKIQDRWVKGTTPVVAATNAFGMGIDKPDCRFVIHYDMPASIEAYYQEAGRAGRDGGLSFPVLLYRDSDFKRLEKSILDNYPEFGTLKKIYSALCDSWQLATGTGMEDFRQADLKSVSKRSGLTGRVVSGGLKVLSNCGVIELETIYEPSVGVTFTTDKNGINALLTEVTNTGKKEFIDALFRIFPPGRQESPEFTDLKSIAARLNQTPNAVLKGLEILRNENMLNFEYRKDDPIARLTEPRQPRLPITSADAEAYRNILIKKLAYMRGFAVSDTCRSVYLRVYFGEENPAACGMCDNCMSKGNMGYLDESMVKVIYGLIRDQPATAGTLIEKSGLTHHSVYLALNWLLKEDKIMYSEQSPVRYRLTKLHPVK
jgi:ATP-dependent DNA helicase RecQ